ISDQNECEESGGPTKEMARRMHNLGVRFGPVMKEANKPDSGVACKTTEQKFSMNKVAELIRVHVSTVSRLMDSGKLGYYQIGQRRVVGAGHLPPAFIDAFPARRFQF